MTGISISGANRVRNVNSRGESFVSNTNEKSSIGEKKKNSVGLMVGATALAAVVIGGVLATNSLKKTKKGLDVIRKVTDDSAIKLNGIRFEKGKAYLKSGENYSGELNLNLRSGNNVSMIYQDGRLQSATVESKNGDCVSKKYEYYDDTSPSKSGKLKKVLVDRQGVRSFVEIERSIYGDLTETKVVTPKKTITCKKTVEVFESKDGYDSAENNILTTGLRVFMPGKKKFDGYQYPYARVTDIKDSEGNHTIIRKFINGMKDILKLNENGTSGTIEHFDERGKFISKIKRTPEEVYENPVDTTEANFVAGVRKDERLDKRLYFRDIVYDSKENIIGNRQNYIKVPYVSPQQKI